MNPPFSIFSLIEGALAAPDPQRAWHRATMWSLAATSAARPGRAPLHDPRGGNHRAVSAWTQLTDQLKGAEAFWMLAHEPDIAECIREPDAALARGAT